MPRLAGTRLETFVRAFLALGAIVYGAGLLFDARGLQVIGLLPVALFVLFAFLMVPIVIAIVVVQAIWRRSK